MRHIEFSVITPVYNSFHLMEKYFESLEKQTFKNFEIIIIDDCSEDKSYQKLMNYKLKSKLNIKILKNEKNKGPGEARNYGLKAVEGKWITFIDNDDWIVEDFFERIYFKLYQGKSNIDCLIFDYYIQRKGKIKGVGKSIINGQIGQVSLSICLKYMTNHTAGKVYNSEIIKKYKINFPDFRRSEDVVFNMRAIKYCKKIYYLGEPLYCYCQRDNSVSNNSKLDERYIVEAYRIIKKEYSNHYEMELKEKSLKDLLYGGVLMMCKAKKNNRVILEYIMNYEKEYPECYSLDILYKLGKIKYFYILCIKYRFINVLKFLTYIHTKLIK